MLARCSRQVVQRSYLRLLQASQFASSAALKEEPRHPSPSDLQRSAKLLFSSKPRSLSVPPESKLRVVEYERTGITGFGLRLLGYYNQESKLFRGARTLYYRLYYLVESHELYATFGLEKSFRTRHAMSIIHVWMCLVRARSEKPDGATFGQALYDLYNEDLEHGVAAAGVKIMFSKWMKELEKMFYGAVKAYDEAMKPEASKDDLAQALWRNVFSENDTAMPSGELAIHVQRLANYVRRETACLALTDKDSIFSGNIIFSTDLSWKRV